jgi:D-hexose-6-phosphate mutarotase
MEKSNVTFCHGNGGLPKIEIHTEWSDAEIYLLGAHVTKFQRKGEAPLLFVSEKSRFEKGHPIRGGVPIIFPWFGAREGKPAHGFARNQTWELSEISHTSENVTLKLRLPDSPEAKEFPKFTAEYFVTVGETLALELRITNQSNQNFSFENCLHTYFAVGDIDAVSVGGLKGVEYLDKVENFARKTETNERIKFSSETDRVYLNTTGACEIHDAKLQRVIIVEKHGSASTVVWNPWIAKAKAMSDFGDDEYPRMVCVESGNVSENKLILSSGESSSLRIDIRTRGTQVLPG